MPSKRDGSEKKREEGKEAQGIEGKAPSVNTVHISLFCFKFYRKHGRNHRAETCDLVELELS